RSSRYDERGLFMKSRARMSFGNLTVAVGLVLVVFWAGSLWAASDGSSAKKYYPVRPAIPGQFLILLPDETPAETVPDLARALARQYGGEVESSYAVAIRGFSIIGMSEKQARSLASDKRVKSVEQVARVFPAGERVAPGWALDRIDERVRPLSGVYRYSADG